MVSITPWSFYPRVSTPVHIEYHIGWAPEPAWELLGMAEFSCPCWDLNPGLPSPQTSRYSDSIRFYKGESNDELKRVGKKLRPYGV